MATLGHNILPLKVVTIDTLDSVEIGLIPSYPLVATFCMAKVRMWSGNLCHNET